MPLPADRSGPWPPKYLDVVTERVASWSAWYSGDPDEIAATYHGGSTESGFSSAPRTRPSQLRGGIVGGIARMFWGQPTPSGEQRTKLHIPLAGDIAAKSSKLLFSEPIVFRLPNTDEAAQKRLDKLIDDSVHVALLEAGEVGAGLGGVYLRIVWDPSVRDRPWLTAVHADAAVPEWAWDRLAAVTFWREVERDGSKVIRHLERYEPGVILHGLYEGSQDQLGTQIPLDRHPTTAPIARGVGDSTGDGLTIAVGTDVPNKLAAVYIPNMRPSRVWRNTPAGANLGRADIQGVEPEMDALDETWTSWMRDIRLGKGRAFVAESMLQNNGPGKGATFDPDREIYQQLNSLPAPTATMAQQITLHQFEIRVAEHSQTAEELTTIITRGAGYSAGSFGLKGAEAITATEVDARNTDSFLTRNHKVLYWRPELAEIIETLMAIDAAKFGAGVTPQRPDIEWPDGIAESAETRARTIQLLAAAEAISTQTRVEMANPGWDEKRVAEEVKRILAETGRTVEDPGTFNGGDNPPGGGPEQQEPPEV